MDLLNINGTSSDNFYRYKMSPVVVKTEGKGNGIKTILENLMKISKEIRQDPIYLLKFIGYELGAQINVDRRNERYIVNGNHRREELQSLIGKFIERYVLCKTCGNPETQLFIRKRLLYQGCRACGTKERMGIENKMNRFITKTLKQ